ncbi:DUF255 domain-containing protein [Microbacterium sp. 1P10UB]|uniref:thioredoxin domain-containing protein n=1 Tax=unclassified Microbacterium TaxID=2609290 RepID=UPI00399F3CEA
MASRLADATSPYLRAHADNPVAWFPWEEEAFAEARRRDVPVMVSIGYSTCHWCHVMARESFADAATAAVLNDGFVSVKVDREEHPEVDAAYMAAAGAFTRNLGWPLTVFTTPDGQPFFAGTYWPPEARPPMAGFPQVLGAVREAWTQRRSDVVDTGTQLAAALARLGEVGVTDETGTPTREQLTEAAERLVALEDREYGGFAAAGAGIQTPKFPTVPALRFLQAPGLDGAAAAVAARALAAMASSELRDAVDGGFFRYATRRDWTVPHFERMLTDNAGLVDVALDAGDDRVARGTASFLREVLQLPSGGFAAAQDSESTIDGARSEGGYYLRDAAGRRDLAPPAVDNKVVTGWNGMAIGALARAGLALDEPGFIEAARWAADAVLEVNVDDDGMLRRASLDEIPSRAPAALEDWGLLAGGLFDLAAATGEPAYAVRARELLDACITEDSGELTVRAPGGGDPVLAAQGLAAPADESDGDHPSGRSAVAAAAFTAWALGAGDRYRRVAATLAATAAPSALAQPIGAGAMLRVAAQLADGPRQAVVITTRRTGALVDAARRIRADVLAILTPAQAEAFVSAGFALFEGKTAQGGAPTLYDCHDFACRLPVTAPDQVSAER